MKKIFFIMAILVFFSGCFRVYTPVQTRYPVIEMPQKPFEEKISADELYSLRQETLNKLVNNNKNIKNYVKKLEVSIKLYNEFAEKENKKDYDN